MADPQTPEERLDVAVPSSEDEWLPMAAIAARDGVSVDEVFRRTLAQGLEADGGATS